MIDLIIKLFNDAVPGFIKVLLIVFIIGQCFELTVDSTFGGQSTKHCSDIFGKGGTQCQDAVRLLLRPLVQLTAENFKVSG